METLFENTILKKYGNVRNESEDKILVEKNIYPHIYSVEDRVDLTSHICHTIDPEGCSDADDGFSIIENGKGMYLAIHIADPTYYVKPDSDLWKNTVSRVITHYPSKKLPIHMLPNKIMELASLKTEKDEEMKLAISIVVKINDEGSRHLKISNEPEIVFSKIKVSKDASFSYNKADKDNKIIQTALKISKIMRESRGITKKIYTTSNIIYTSTGSELLKNTQMEQDLKEMIEEFAVFANSAVGKYLNDNIDGSAIFRTCKGGENIDYTNIVMEIITGDISAKYDVTGSPHEIVGSKHYCHFTSPIRRLSDCIVHYLLKYLHLVNIGEDVVIPFTRDELEFMAQKCTKKSKIEKKITREDQKFRVIEILYSMIQSGKNPLITIKFISYINGYINFLITEIDEHMVNIMYCIRNSYPKKLEMWKQNKNGIVLKIKTINPYAMYDEDKFPDITTYILKE